MLIIPSSQSWLVAFHRPSLDNHRSKSTIGLRALKLLLIAYKRYRRDQIIVGGVTARELDARISNIEWNKMAQRSEDDNSLRQWLTTIISRGEDIVYLGLAVLLAASALAFLVVEAVGFWRTIIDGALAENIVPLLDQLLLIIIIVELLFTVKVSFREHVLEPQPFLIVAVIAVSRRIIVLTAELSKLLKADEQVFQHALWELAILTVLAVALVISLRLLRPQEHKVEG